jgi:Uncharacterised protein family UPF0547
VLLSRPVLCSADDSGTDHFLFFLAACLGIVTGLIAFKKERSFWGWWLFGFLLAIVAIPAALLVEPLNVKECPECAENVKKWALKCRYCGHVFVHELTKDEIT